MTEQLQLWEQSCPEPARQSLPSCRPGQRPASHSRLPELLSAGPTGSQGWSSRCLPLPASGSVVRKASSLRYCRLSGTRADASPLEAEGEGCRQRLSAAPVWALMPGLKDVSVGEGPFPMGAEPAMLTCFRELPGPSGLRGGRLGAGAQSSGSWDLCSLKAHLWDPVGHGASPGSRPFWLVVDPGQRPGQGFRAVPVGWLPLQCGEGVISWQLRECMLGKRPVVRLVLSEARLCLRYPR